MTPYSRPSVEIAVASQVSPTGARAAGRHGVGLLSIGATTAGGFNALALQLGDRRGDGARERHDHGPLALASGRADAYRRDARAGPRERPLRAGEVAVLFPQGGRAADRAGRRPDPMDALDRSPAWRWSARPTIAWRRSSGCRKQTGGFGCFLQLAHNWANWEDTKHSYELFARYVMPKFQDLNVNRETSLEWARKQSRQLHRAGDRGGRVAHLCSTSRKRAPTTSGPEILDAMGMSKKPAAPSILDAISPLPGKSNGK